MYTLLRKRGLPAWIAFQISRNGNRITDYIRAVRCGFIGYVYWEFENIWVPIFNTEKQAKQYNEFAVWINPKVEKCVLFSGVVPQKIYYM